MIRRFLSLLLLFLLTVECVTSQESGSHVKSVKQLGNARREATNQLLSDISSMVSGLSQGRVLAEAQRLSFQPLKEDDITMMRLVGTKAARSMQSLYGVDHFHPTDLLTCHSGTVEEMSPLNLYSIHYSCPTWRHTPR